MRGLAQLRKLWLSWFLLSHGLGSAHDFVDVLYRIYLNHSKIIHFRDGFPVYSLSTPALFSRPAHHFIARTLYRGIQNRNIPNLMSLAVTDGCNARCSHCSFYQGVEEPGRPLLSLEQTRELIRQAQELGVSIINLVGGEPLQRPDLSEIIRSVDKDLSTVLLFTNGWHLAEQAVALRRAGLDSVYVSLDAADAARHDQRRGLPGLFVRALQGLRAARRQGLSVGISATLTPEDYAAGELERLVELARRVGAHEVLVFDALPSGRLQHRDDLVDREGHAGGDDWVERMIRSADGWNADPRYPGVVFSAYISSHRSVGCACGTSYFYLSPYGDVMSCDFNHAIFGNAVQEPLWRVWQRLSDDPDFQRAKWGGCKVKDSGFRAKPTVRGGAATTVPSIAPSLVPSVAPSPDQTVSAGSAAEPSPWP
ncbi:radical SAM protein [Synechococcus sp. CCY9202]|uniref:radical SAM/SPASM domain-containing protein n=1 Tax=Synechococcus sp. CCY9202 TaxID=174698 RepID=UPI002B1E94BD|nr:radical SAM protein [Synechococcus sp. CCY9202]MEA5422750.1 radical SAM protein [Synechococcus sp. CCY9202]